MLDILSHRVYRRLLLAQVSALLGTGVATVALGLLAYDLAGEGAALVLGTVFTIKMIAYVGVAPLAGAVASRVDRRRLLVALDGVRAVCALCLPFASEVWHVYALIFALQSASAAFTPTFQATIPDILPEEGAYTRALSLSRLAYDLENIASPALAALLLAVLGAEALFFGTALGFAASALLVASVLLPSPTPGAQRGALGGATRGIRLYLATPRLRGLLALNLAAAGAGAMVLVNSASLTRGTLGLGESALAWTMFAFGAGSMTAALAAPRLLARAADRPVMLGGAATAVAALLGLAGGIATLGLNWPMLLGAWALIGLGYSAVLTPAGRLLRRSAPPADRPALFAAQFALSHACWLLAYPLAGWLMTRFGAVPALLGLTTLAAAGIGAALRLWPAAAEAAVAHSHDDLPPDHPHLQEAHPEATLGQGTGPETGQGRGPRRHAHPPVADELHPQWAGRF